MFRRRTPDAPAETLEESMERLREQGKGRPTPKRSEAEALRKQRLQPPRDRKEAKRLMKQKQYEGRLKTQEAMKTGEDRYLPARDQGKVRRFVRDLVDSRWNAAEFLLPILVVILVLGFVPGAGPVVIAIWLSTILFTIVDTVMLFFRTKRELKMRFPPDDIRGSVAYAVLRSSQLRRLRMPKPQVKRGTPLPDHH